MIIYAIFFCIRTMNYGCQPELPVTYYRSLAQCENSIQQLFGSPVKPDRGRFYAYDPKHTEWYQCLARPVNTWQQP